MPSGNNPKGRRDIDRGELRLGQANPVLVGDRSGTQNFAAFKKILGLQQFSSASGGRFFRKQCGEARALPTVLGRWHARFTKKSDFGIGLCISVFDADTQCVQGL